MMFEKMLGWIRTTIFKLMGKENTELTISPKMETLIDLWARCILPMQKNSLFNSLC